MKAVRKFLVINGFNKLNKNSYTNDLCNVVIEKENYVVADNYGTAMYSKDHNIYWLIGVLTYYGFMDKDYKQLSTPEF